MAQDRDPERDQRLPIMVEGPVIHRLVQDDLEERLVFGMRKYGQPLQAHNGRNALLDGYEEILDLAVYLKTFMEERRDMLSHVKAIESHLTMVYRGVEPVPSVVSHARELRKWMEA